MNQNQLPKRSDEPIFWGIIWCRWYVGAIVSPANYYPARYSNPDGYLRPEAFTYDRIMAFSQGFIGRIFLLLMIILPVWCALHRIHHTLRDF